MSDLEAHRAIAEYDSDFEPLTPLREVVHHVWSWELVLSLVVVHSTCGGVARSSAASN